MSEEDRKTEELEDEKQIEETEDEEDDGTCSQGEILFNALKDQKLVEETWADLSNAEKKKYEYVADDVM
jgi:hypothetical protein